MVNKNYVVKPEEMKVVDGKVVIDSEELAAAIQDHSLDLEAEEEMADFNLCVIVKTAG